MLIKGGFHILEKGDLVRCRHRIIGKDPQYWTTITIGIVLWTKNEYSKVFLQNGQTVLAHRGDMELISRSEDEEKN